MHLHRSSLSLARWGRGACLALLLAGPARFAAGGVISGQVVTRGNNQPVAQALVYLGARSRRTTDATARQPVIVDVSGGRLGPRLQIAAPGAPLILQNSDATLHMVRVEEISTIGPRRRLQQVAMPYAGFERMFRLPTSGSTRLFWVIGDHQQTLGAAYLAVIPHPWSAVTAADGTFTIKDVPSGRYPVFAWHEQRGALQGRAVLQASQRISLRLAYPSPGSD